jgi:hypothetical protein
MAHHCKWQRSIAWRREQDCLQRDRARWISGQVKNLLTRGRGRHFTCSGIRGGAVQGRRSTRNAAKPVLQAFE